MRASLVVILASGLAVAGCAGANSAGLRGSPVSPAVVSSAGAEMQASGDAGVPFHSELTWAKTPGNDISLCTHALPPGKVYMMRNTNRGTAVSTHLGVGEYENHTCVYGASGVPEGWFADIRWTAANGDVLLATSDFIRWTGLPGKSVAIDRVTFQNGGTGRFEFADGEGMVYVNAPERTAVYDGTLRYGKKEK